MKRIISFLYFLAGGLLTFGQNPISPPGVYIADPAAHAWKDGRLYVYGSLDESTDYYCSHRHHVMSTDNMLDWTLHRDVFASKGENDQVAYSDALLYAPDCQYRDGTYYLYYTLASPQQTEGVATSKNPEGPFKNGRGIDLHGFNQIDPATIRDSIVTEDEHFFHEGGYLVKRNDIYGGVIIDNDHSDPSVWNNHGSVMMRKACVEPIEFNKDGSITEVEMPQDINISTLRTE